MKILKILGITVLSILVLLYLAFLFVLPNVVKLNDFKPMVQQIAKEQANLNVDFDNAKIIVTPLLSVGAKVDNLKVTFADNSELFNADTIQGRIALPSLFLLTVKVSNAEVINPIINLDIVDGKSIKLIDELAVVVDKNEQQIVQKNQEAVKPAFDVMSIIKIKVPKVKIENYEVKLSDLKSTNFLKLRGDELLLGYFNGKTAYLKTNAELFVNDTKNINANIDIDTMIPPATELDKEDDKAQSVEMPFINPVAMYMQYDVKADIDSKLKIRNGKYSKKIVSKGYFNIDNLTLKLADFVLPKSSIHATTRGTNVNLETDLYIAKQDKINLIGNLNYGKRPFVDMTFKTTEIPVDNVLSLTKSALNAFSVPHELAPLKANGTFKADTYIKSNFKKLNSTGNITIKDCSIKNTKNNLQLVKANSIISLENNMLEFIDTIIEVAQTSFKLGGTIDAKSNADISLSMQKLPVEKVFTTFLPDEINKVYAVNSGDINLNADIKGELKKAIGNVSLSVDNLSLLDKVNKINYSNGKLTADFVSDFKKFTGDVNNNNFKLSMNGATIGVDKLNINIAEKDVVIAPSQIKINSASVLNLQGNIKNYIKNPDFNFALNGDIATSDLKQLLGKDLAIFIDQKGKIPVDVAFVGDKEKQTLTAKIEADGNNYITPINIKNVLNKNTLMQAVVDFKGDRLKIKDTGLFIKTVTQDEKNPEKTTVKLTDIINVDGTITKLNTANPHINLIKVKVPEDINATIFAFPASNLSAKGNVYLYSDLATPKFRGDFKVWDFSIPELFLSIDKIVADFEGKDLDINVVNVLANGSDYNVSLKADLSPSKNFVIKNVNVISKLTDVDKLMKIVEASMKYMPQSAPSTTSNASTSTASADIPVVVKDGSIDIKHIKTGAINLYDTTGKLSLANNVLYVNNLITSAFQGKVTGDVSVNLINSLIKANVKGKGLDVEDTLLSAAAMKDTLSGTMDFNADISLQGATYEEQMASLLGEVTFSMKDGDLGPFGKLENLIMAENIRENAFFQSTIGSILHSLLSFDTAHYNTLTGKVTFKDGVVDIPQINSAGDIMATHIFGKFDLLKNTIDIKLRGRLGSQVSESMGVLSYLNPIKLLKATPGMSLVLGKMFFLFTEAVTQADMDMIPALGKDIDDVNSTKFQVVLRGDVAKPLTLVKSFKWMALQSDIDKASSQVNALPADTLPDLSSFGIDINNLNSEEVKTQVKEQAKKQVQQALDNAVSEETKQSIQEAKQTVEKAKESVNKLKDIFKSDKTKQEELKQQALSKLQSKLNEVLTVPQEETQE